MFRYRIRELLAEKERQLGRRITRGEVSEATGIAVQVISSLTSPINAPVTNTAHLEALIRFFNCTPNDLLILEPPVIEGGPCHIDELYPNRRRAGG